MSYCCNCGKQIEKDSKFCLYCGAPNALYVQAQTKRETVYEGKLHKCPNCGELMNPFETKCNMCGYIIRSTNATSSVKEFERRFEQVLSVDKKIDFIKTFAVPNTQEDLMEFAVLAAMNIDLDAYKMEHKNTDDIRLSNAWLAKLEQAHEKAEVLFDNTPIWNKIDNLYQKRMKALSEIKSKNRRNKILGVFPRFILYVYRKLAGWAVTILLLGVIFYYYFQDILVASILFLIGIFLGILSLVDSDKR